MSRQLRDDDRGIQSAGAVIITAMFVVSASMVGGALYTGVLDASDDGQQVEKAEVRALAGDKLLVKPTISGPMETENLRVTVALEGKEVTITDLQAAMAASQPVEQTVEREVAATTQRVPVYETREEPVYEQVTVTETVEREVPTFRWTKTVTERTPVYKWQKTTTRTKTRISATNPGGGYYSTLLSIGGSSWTRQEQVRTERVRTGTHLERVRTGTRTYQERVFTGYTYETDCHTIGGNSGGGGGGSSGGSSGGGLWDGINVYFDAGPVPQSIEQPLSSTGDGGFAGILGGGSTYCTTDREANYEWQTVTEPVYDWRRVPTYKTRAVYRWTKTVEETTTTRSTTSPGASWEKVRQVDTKLTETTKTRTAHEQPGNGWTKQEQVGTTTITEQVQHQEWQQVGTEEERYISHYTTQQVTRTVEATVTGYQFTSLNADACGPTDDDSGDHDRGHGNDEDGEDEDNPGADGGIAGMANGFFATEFGADEAAVFGSAAANDVSCISPAAFASTDGGPVTDAMSGVGGTIEASSPSQWEQGEGLVIDLKDDVLDEGDVVSVEVVNTADNNIPMDKKARITHIPPATFDAGAANPGNAPVDTGAGENNPSNDNPSDTSPSDDSDDSWLPGIGGDVPADSGGNGGGNSGSGGAPPSSGGSNDGSDEATWGDVGDNPSDTGTSTPDSETSHDPYENIPEETPDGVSSDPANDRAPTGPAQHEEPSSGSGTDYRGGHAQHDEPTSGGAGTEPTCDQIDQSAGNSRCEAKVPDEGTAESDPGSGGSSHDNTSDRRDARDQSTDPSSGPSRGGSSGGGSDTSYDHGSGSSSGGSSGGSTGGSSGGSSGSSSNTGGANGNYDTLPGGY